jgi:protein-disulfide isomerase
MVAKFTAGIALALALFMAPAGAQQLTKPQEDEVRAIVRDYLLKNPEIIEEAMAALELKRASARNAEVANDPRHFSMGPKMAPFTVVEFFDYQCPYCHVAADWVFDTLRTRRDVRVIFVEYPILGPVSVEAAQAAAASIKQGKYEQFHRALMGVKGKMTSKSIDDAARKVGMDVARLRRDMRDPAIEKLFADNLAMGQKWGVSGTPAFMVNGQFTHGADFAELDRMLRPAGGKTR